MQSWDPEHTHTASVWNWDPVHKQSISAEQDPKHTHNIRVELRPYTHTQHQ